MQADRGITGNHDGSGDVRMGRVLLVIDQVGENIQIQLVTLDYGLLDRSMGCQTWLDERVASLCVTLTHLTRLATQRQG